MGPPLLITHAGRFKRQGKRGGRRTALREKTVQLALMRVTTGRVRAMLKSVGDFVSCTIVHTSPLCYDRKGWMGRGGGGGYGK